MKFFLLTSYHLSKRTGFFVGCMESVPDSDPHLTIFGKTIISTYCNSAMAPRQENCNGVEGYWENSSDLKGKYTIIWAT